MAILGWIIFGALTGWIASRIVNRASCGPAKRMPA